MKALVLFWCLALVSLLAACGRGASGYSYSGVSASTPSRPPSVAQPAKETVKAIPLPAKAPAPVLAPASPAPEKPKPIALEVYNRAPRTELALYEAKASAALVTQNPILGVYDFFSGLDDLVQPPLFGRKKPKPSEEIYREITKEFDEYEKMMDGEYYFARVTKFRAPETATADAHYTWYFAVTPHVESAKGSTELARKSEAIKMGKAHYLRPGGVGKGSDWIIAIPRREVQSLFGYWDEKVQIQLGVLEVDINRIERQDYKDVDEVAKPILLQLDVVDFHAMKENRVYSWRYQTKTPQGTSDAVISVEYWKGSWRTNN